MALYPQIATFYFRNRVITILALIEYPVNRCCATRCVYATLIVSMHPIQEKILQLSKVRDLSTLSYREIGRQVADADDSRVHPQNIKYHIDQLINNELLHKANRPLVKASNTLAKAVTPRLIRIPIKGSASCGPATVFANDKAEGYIDISPHLLKSKNYYDLYALKAIGSSMNDTSIMGKSINDGDYVVVDGSKRTPRDGDCVVVVRDDLANIKRIYFDHDEEMIILRSESTEDYNPIYISPQDSWDGLIGGTVIQVVKQFA